MTAVAKARNHHRFQMGGEIENETTAGVASVEPEEVDSSNKARGIARVRDSKNRHLPLKKERSSPVRPRRDKTENGPVPEQENQPCRNAVA